MTTAQEILFWSKVVVAESCWEWCGAVSSGGYGNIRWGKVNKPAHRVSYEHYVGPIPDGLDLDHLCRNRNCVNPAHLEPVTRQTNLLRGRGLTALHHAKTHCVRGHPLQGDNLSAGGLARGARECRQCWSARRKENRG